MFSAERLRPEILEYSIKKEIEKHLRPRRLKEMDLLIGEILHDVMDTIPVAAFEERYAHQAGYLVFQGDVEEERCENMQLELLSAHLSMPKAQDINILLSSFGGVWDYGLAVMAVMHKIQAEGRKVNVHITGSAMSMGTIITQAATKRTMDQYGSFMIHEAWESWGPQKYRESQDYMVGLKKMHEAMYKIYASRSGKPVEYWEERIKRRDVFLTAEEALAEGLIDGIIYSPFKT